MDMAWWLCRIPKAAIQSGLGESFKYVTSNPNIALENSTLLEYRRVSTMPFRLEYPITRPFTLPYFTHGVLVAIVIWGTFITLLNVAVIGYDTVPVANSLAFNSSTLLWYETFALTAFWLPTSWTCSPSTIMPGQS